MDLICYSHLRWNFVYQRPQHIISRFAKNYRTFYFEEPLFFEIEQSFYTSEKNEDVTVVTPNLSKGLNARQVIDELRSLLIIFAKENKIVDHIAWYYTPMALEFSRQLEAKIVVYDCMDELSNFKFAPPELKTLELELFTRADIVFTGGVSLFHAKKKDHQNIHAFPSSIDKAHFVKARVIDADPLDQKNIPHPRFGFYGVIDERFDLSLLESVAFQKPQWNFVIIGPVVKIDPSILPQLPNIYYPGGKTYKELPAYLSGWDVAIIPFLLNESTRYISPTKTPEYLAGGKPVISASITDVVDPYGKEELVYIADNAADFIAAGEKILKNSDKLGWLAKVDRFLQNNSWDNTWKEMNELVEKVKIKNEKTLNNLKQQVYV